MLEVQGIIFLWVFLFVLFLKKCNTRIFKLLHAYRKYIFNVKNHAPYVAELYIK